MTAADEAESAAAVASSRDSPGNPVDSIKPVEPGRDSGLGNRAVSPPDESPEAPGRVPGGPGAERCDDFASRGEELTRVVSEEMDGFDGDWGFALIDIECRMEISVHAEHSQYPASAGKIVIVIAALRGVGDGSIESEPELFQDVEDILISLAGDACRPPGGATFTGANLRSPGAGGSFESIEADRNMAKRVLHSHRPRAGLGIVVAGRTA